MPGTLPILYRISQRMSSGLLVCRSLLCTSAGLPRLKIVLCGSKRFSVFHGHEAFCRKIPMHCFFHLTTNIGLPRLRRQWLCFSPILYVGILHTWCPALHTTVISCFFFRLRQFVDFGIYRLHRHEQYSVTSVPTATPYI